ncbi:MAG: nitric oxide reductase activation protein, partial [Mycobacterium sp.]
MTETPHPTGLKRLQLFASALAGQPVAVEPATAEQAAWTDGQTIFVNPGASPRQRLAALTGQACLIAAGSLEPDIMRTLARRPKLARRYLAVEIPRALMINEALIPVHVASLFRRSTVDTVETSAADASL